MKTQWKYVERNSKIFKLLVNFFYNLTTYSLIIYLKQERKLQYCNEQCR